MKKSKKGKERRLTNWTPKLRAAWRAKGYHIGCCWKCGVEFAYKHRTYLPEKKVYKTICPRCRVRMWL